MLDAPRPRPGRNMAGERAATAVFLAAILYYVLKLIPEEERSSSQA